MKADASTAVKESEKASIPEAGAVKEFKKN